MCVLGSIDIMLRMSWKVVEENYFLNIVSPDTLCVSIMSGADGVSVLQVALFPFYPTGAYGTLH